MTITAETITVTHDCDDEVTDFIFEFKIFDEDDIKVIATDSDGAETELTITTDYTVAGENGAFDSGGTVSTVKEVDGTMESYAYADGYTITIILELALKQETDLEYGGSYSSAAIELMSDRLTKIVQQLDEKFKRAILFKRSSKLSGLEIVDPSSGYYLYSDDGESVTWVENVATGTATITAFIKTLLDDADASDALTTLGLTTYIKTLVDDANAYTARKTLKTPLNRVVAAKTENYTVVAGNDGALILVDATAENIAITLPAVDDVWNGFAIGIKKTDESSNYVESTPDGSEEVDGASSHFLRVQNATVWYVVDGTGWQISSEYSSIGQVVFPATALPSSDPNTLDDYEEGTFDVAWVCGTSGTITLLGTEKTLSYVKIGKQATITGQMVVDSVSNPSGNLTVTGLPFTVGGDGEATPGIGIYATTFAAGATTAIVGRAVPATTTMEFRIFATGTASTALADEVQASSVLAVCVTFLI